MPSHRFAVAAFSAIALSPLVGAASVPLFVGPSEVWTAEYNQYGLVVPYPAPVTGNGVGVLVQRKFATEGTDLGDRAMRWTPAGVAELGTMAPASHANDYTNTHVNAVNFAGTAVGNATYYQALNSPTNWVPAGIRAVRWDAGKTSPTVLQTPWNYVATGLTRSEATAVAVNASGAAAGWGKDYSYSTAGFHHAIRWRADGSGEVLQNFNPPNSGNRESEAAAINASGVAVGWAQRNVNDAPSLYGTLPIRWDAASSALSILQPLPAGVVQTGPAYSQATAINDTGVIVGYSDVALPNYRFNDRSFDHRVMRWDAGSNVPAMLGVPAISGYLPGDSHPTSLNAAGTTVGNVDVYAEATDFYRGQRAVRWDAHSAVPVELGGLGFTSNGTTFVAVDGINDSGYATGIAYRYDVSNVETPCAVVWGPDAQPIDLNTLIDPASGWHLTCAYGISNTGWVTATATRPVNGTNALPKQVAGMLLLLPQAGTYGRGDANFDTAVDFDDLIILAQNYNKANASLATTVADLDLDGQTNFDDLIVLAQHYNTSPAAAASVGDAAFAADWALAQSLVPEPTIMMAIAVVPVVARRRR